MALASFPKLPDRPLSKRGRTEETAQFFFQRKETFPRFHVIHSENPGKTVRMISPFTVAKNLTETIGPGYKVTKMASGDLLLEVRDKQQYDKLPNLVSLGGVNLTVTPHRSMNTSRGVISDDDLLYLTEEELLEGWKEQNVTIVKRIIIKRENKEIPTKHLIVTFASSVLPETLETGYTKVRVRPYIPNPRRCFKCQRYGHGSQSCRGRQTCAKCGDHDHPSDDCDGALHCSNCDGGHAAYSRACPTWQKEKDIITLKVKENISFQEARKRVSFLHSTKYADTVRKGAAPQQTPAAARSTKSVAAEVPPAPLVKAASTASPSLMQGPSTSGLIGSKASSLEARSSRRPHRSQERMSSTSQEAMDTNPSQTAQPAPKDRRESQDRGKKDKPRITAPGKGSVS